MRQRLSESKGRGSEASDCGTNPSRQSQAAHIAVTLTRRRVRRTPPHWGRWRECKSTMMVFGQLEPAFAVGPLNVRFQMQRLRVTLVALALVAANPLATAQQPAVSRHTEELSVDLERDAVTALARQQFVDAFYIVCKRVSPQWADSASEQHRAWHARNQNHIQVATAIIEAIGENLAKIENARARQSYFTATFRKAEAFGTSESAKQLNGAMPSNAIIPAGESCLLQLANLEGRNYDFTEFPEQTVALRSYARKYFPDLAVR